MFLDRFVDHVLLIPWLCADLLGGKSGVRCAMILTMARSQKNQNLELRLYRYYIKYPYKEVEIGQNQGLFILKNADRPATIQNLEIQLWTREYTSTTTQFLK